MESSAVFPHPSKQMLEARCRRWYRLCVHQRFHSVLSAAAHTLGGVSCFSNCKLATARRACQAGEFCRQVVFGCVGCLLASLSSHRMNLSLLRTAGWYGSACISLSYAFRWNCLLGFVHVVASLCWSFCVCLSLRSSIGPTLLV